MRRINNLYEKVYSIENLKLAATIASKGKSKQYGVIVYHKKSDEYIMQLHELLKTKTFKTSDYTIFKIYEQKEREIYRLPFFPDRIAHHAVMNILEPIWVSSFTSDTYSCIKKRGVRAAENAVKKALRDVAGTQFCSQLDVKKFYPNVDHAILKQIIRKKIKDKDLLWLLDEIIDSAPGVPIGNYLSQYFANLYLSYFDHWIKEEKKVKYYFRYADDLVILAGNKPYLHRLLAEIRQYMTINLNLVIKENYQIYPVALRGVDFVGYRFYHTHTLLRKRIKKNFARMLAKNRNHQAIASYYGWALGCNSKNLLKKLLNEKI